MISMSGTRVALRGPRNAEAVRPQVSSDCPDAEAPEAAGRRGRCPASAVPASIGRRDLLHVGLGLLAAGAAHGRPGWSRAAERPVGQTPPGDAPRLVKGAYLSYYGVGNGTIRGRVLELLDSTELNAVVIDVKGDRGLIPYDSDVPLARSAGAMGPVRVRDFDDMLAHLKAKGVYTIARIVGFKDHVLAGHRPRWAITDTRTGALWLDAEHLAWLDPFEEEAWAYVIAVAAEAARKGFDEIQFDYVRFPTDGKLSAARYSQANTQERRLEALTAFFRRARAVLEPIGPALAVDVFGYTAFNRDDTGIGQRLEELGPLVDTVSPMAYPSAYHLGIPGHRNPVAHPREVVSETVRRARDRLAGTGAAVRPWIQDFRDYAFDRRPFGVAEVRAQMAAAVEAGATGWMLWNPQNRYTAEALRGKGPAEEAPARDAPPPSDGASPAATASARAV